MTNEIALKLKSGTKVISIENYSGFSIGTSLVKGQIYEVVIVEKAINTYIYVDMYGVAIPWKCQRFELVSELGRALFGDKNDYI